MSDEQTSLGGALPSTVSTPALASLQETHFCFQPCTMMLYMPCTCHDTMNI
jgi:hypothetical protein